jgi:hypothetical protein
MFSGLRFFFGFQQHDAGKLVYYTSRGRDYATFNVLQTVFYTYSLEYFKEIQLIPYKPV